MALKKNFYFNCKDKGRSSIPLLSKHKDRSARPATGLCAKYGPGRGTGPPTTNMATQPGELNLGSILDHQDRRAASHRGLLLG